MTVSLLDLPNELLLEILVKFDSYHTYKALSETSRSFRALLKEIIVIINDTDKNYLENGLIHLNINRISIEQMNQLIERYDYFVFDLSCKNGLTNTIQLMKIILKNLQKKKKYHSITIKGHHSSQSINNNPLIRFLLPKMKSCYTEFFFPFLRSINGFDDLRVLDNTQCYFHELMRLTIGSFSFQLFNLKAPMLKTMNYNDQLKKRAFNETVTSSKISFSNFLSNLSFTNQLEYLEIVNRVEPSTLNRFHNLRILRIYGDHLTKSFDLAFFHNLQELVITKCYLFEEILNLKQENLVNDKLEVLDLSNNKSFAQTIVGEFKRLRVLDLSHTNISQKPQLWITQHHKTDFMKDVCINLEGCRNLTNYQH